MKKTENLILNRRYFFIFIEHTVTNNLQPILPLTQYKIFLDSVSVLSNITVKQPIYTFSSGHNTNVTCLMISTNASTLK